MSDVKESPDLLVKPSFHRKSKYTRDGEKKKMSEESIVIEQLRKIDRLFVERDPAHLHGWFKWQRTKKTYYFRDQAGDVLFEAIEEPGMKIASTTFQFFDAEEIMMFQATYAFNELKSEMMNFRSSEGRYIGSFFKHSNITMDPHYIRDEDDDAVLKVVAPNFDENNGVLKSRDFKLISMNDFDIGYVSPDNMGLAKEFYKDRETLSVIFPQDLHTKIKAMIMGALLFFDYIFYRNDENWEIPVGEDGDALDFSAAYPKCYKTFMFCFGGLDMCQKDPDYDVRRKSKIFVQTAPPSIKRKDEDLGKEEDVQSEVLPADSTIIRTIDLESDRTKSITRQPKKKAFENSGV